MIISHSAEVANEFQVQTQLLYQPNNRLIVNGNFGYSNENANSSTNNNKFIGDVDVEYLLTESGKLRLKAYNHTVDRYRLTTAKTTQGVGVLYKEDFATVGEMISYYWRLLTGADKKKTNNDETETR
ncbi:MAG: translocation/assembly module TamB domain-containing protein [Paludibacter sp.]